MLVIVFELYCVEVLLCSILIWLSVIVGMVLRLIVVELCLIDLLMFNNVEVWLCMLLISISVWFGDRLCRVVGWIVLVLLIVEGCGKLIEGVIVDSVVLSLVVFWCWSVVEFSMLIGDVLLRCDWFVLCVLVMMMLFCGVLVVVGLVGLVEGGVVWVEVWVVMSVSVEVVMVNVVCEKFMSKFLL